MVIAFAYVLFLIVMSIITKVWYKWYKMKLDSSNSFYMDMPRIHRQIYSVLEDIADDMFIIYVLLMPIFLIGFLVIGIFVLFVYVIDLLSEKIFIIATSKNKLNKKG
jgi:hypothetical protein